MTAPDPTAPDDAPREPDGSIHTVSGRWLDPLDPDVGSIEIGDIAQALSNQCRFGGHCRAFYSVAQHCALVADVCRERGDSAAEALTALLHDAGEAYLVDLPHPLKHRSELGPPFRRAEARLEAAIRARFDLAPAGPELKRIDRALLATERRAFAALGDPWPELEGFEPLEIEIEPWEPARARREFLDRFQRLDAERGGIEARVRAEVEQMVAEYRAKPTQELEDQLGLRIATLPPAERDCVPAILLELVAAER